MMFVIIDISIALIVCVVNISSISSNRIIVNCIIIIIIIIIVLALTSAESRGGAKPAVHNATQQSAEQKACGAERRSQCTRSNVTYNTVKSMREIIASSCFCAALDLHPRTRAMVQAKRVQHKTALT